MIAQELTLNELYQRVGRNLLFLRKSMGLSQETFAQEPEINSSQSIISQYERGRK